MPDSILIKDALIVAADAGAAPFYGWVAVRDSRIEAIEAGPPPAPDGFARVIPAGGFVLVPGLVNAHAHSHSTLTRGSAEGLPLEEWLPVIIGEMRRLTDEQAYCAALVTYAEALLSGTTCIVDMCLRPAVAARAAAALGIRVVIVPYVADAMAIAPTLADNQALIERYNTGTGAVQVWVGLHELGTCSDAQVRAAVALARRHAVGLHIHCSETRAAEAATLQRTGRSQIAHLDQLGALGPETLLAHCVWLSEADQAVLARRGGHVAHCPQSNLKLGSGIAPIPQYRAQGINVALGTDGAKANNRLDQFDTMKFASLLPKGLACDATALPAGEVLDMATRGGAALLGLEIGRIAPGCRADLALLRGDRVHLQPVLPETIVTNLVHAARGGDVDTVLVDGKIVVEAGRLVAMPEAELARQARDAAKTLLAGA
jgi:5-methylthioadenosine/S-adenosylhomocysteine deaminase